MSGAPRMRGASNPCSTLNQKALNLSRSMATVFSYAVQFVFPRLSMFPPLVRKERRMLRGEVVLALIACGYFELCSVLDVDAAPL